MTISTGARLPSSTFKTMTDKGIVDVTTDSLLKGKKVALFGLPGAYTPVCSASHLPGYVENAAKLRAAGFTDIACVSVNDPFVMAAWGKEHGATGKVTMLCDVDGSFTRAIGLVADLAQHGLPGSSVVTNILYPVYKRKMPNKYNIQLNRSTNATPTVINITLNTIAIKMPMSNTRP